MPVVDFRCNHAVHSVMIETAALRQLLSGTVDYAGLFPPCSLDLEPALANQATYVRSPDKWMLSTFVLPVARFAEADSFLKHFDREHPLRISALGPKTATVGEFVTAVKQVAHDIRELSRAHVGSVIINQLEMALPLQADAALLSEVQGILAGPDLRAFWEAPPHAAEETIDLLAQHSTTGSDPSFGYKIRTGGVTADAFPTSQQLARALVAATQRRVPIKFTAGLHHPIRQYRDEVQTKMHGFLNVLGAGIMAAQHRWDEGQTTAMLESEDSRAFSFSGEFFQWQNWKVSSDQIAVHRKLITSFGSCSFDEPREDLAALEFR